MITRSFGSRFILSPGRTPRASTNDFMLVTGRFPRSFAGAKVSIAVSSFPLGLAADAHAAPRRSGCSVAELEYQAQVAEWIGADQLTVHGGGATDGKEAALSRWVRGWKKLSKRARSLVVLENDDRIFSVKDLLPLCRGEGVPLIYDVHHHRCHPDGLSEEEATELAAKTWGKQEPWGHLSSPREGWNVKDPHHHSDFIDWKDVPQSWLQRRMTLDVEAKGKERAVLALRDRFYSFSSTSSTLS